MSSQNEPARDSDLRLRAAVESSPAGILMVDGLGRIVLVNREVERLFGYAREELLGRDVEVLVPVRYREGHPGDRQAFYRNPKMRAMGAGRELHGRRKDGSEVPIEIGLTPVVTEEGLFVLSSIVDISARKAAEGERVQLEQQLRQAQKMEAVGTLAGGIAHDFNNILGAIVGYAELARDDLPAGQTRDDLSELLRAASRGKELVERILSFSRHHEPSRRPVDFGQTVSEASRLLRATLPATIDMQLSIGDSVPRVLADAASVQQVVMNLATNGAHAMPEGGVISISVTDEYVQDSVARSHPSLHEGSYVLLAVRDTGVGIDPALKERVFEPFFTTKAPGAGSGLGLAMVHRILSDHDGAVLLDSEPGQGTEVRCYFPSLMNDLTELAAVSETISRGEGERILYVDDEPSLVRLGIRRLERLGYTVVGVTDPHEALELLARGPGTFDLLVTDQAMPGLSGLDLAKLVTAAFPELPIVLLSGYSENLPAATLARAGVRRVMNKPVTTEGLAASLAEVLDEQRH